VKKEGDWNIAQVYFDPQRYKMTEINFIFLWNLRDYPKITVKLPSIVLKSQLISRAGLILPKQNSVNNLTPMVATVMKKTGIFRNIWNSTTGFFGGIWNNTTSFFKNLWPFKPASVI